MVHYGDRICPICGNKEMIEYLDTREFNKGGSCEICGFTFHTEVGQMSLEELNDRRDDYNRDYIEGYNIDKLKRITKEEYEKWRKKIYYEYDFGTL